MRPPVTKLVTRAAKTALQMICGEPPYLVAGAGLEPRDRWVMSTTTCVSTVSRSLARLADLGTLVVALSPSR